MARKCEFRKKNSERCGADAQTGKSLCVFHDPEKHQKAIEPDVPEASTGAGQPQCCR